ncbi:EMB2654, partial [Symbiodinium pilosum]
SLLRAAQQRLLQLNIIAFNAFLGACQNCVQWQRSLVALATMAGNCDVVSFTAAVTACGDSSAWRHAAGLMADVEAQDLHPDFSLLSASMSALTEGASTSTQQGGWLRALEIQGAMLLVRLRPGLGSFNSALRACQRDSAWHGGVAALSQMGRFRISPDEVGCAAVLRGCQQEQAYAPLRRLLDDISCGLLEE